MSDTPRSDEQEDIAKEQYENFREAGWPAFGDVGFDFARQLERELNETKRLLKIADTAYDALRDYIWFLEREAGKTLTQRAKEAFNDRTKQ